VVEDVVVEGEVVAGDDIDAGILLDLPVLESQPLALSEEVLARQLAAQ
jgi:predicted transcriptional regulator